MNIKKIKFGKLKIGSAALVAVFLVALNYFVSQKAAYFDLTEDKVYTTSDVSKRILKDLGRDIKVNFYISKDLPANLQAVKTQLTDLMNQYQDIAGSKLKVTYVEPENTPEKIQELAGKGIPQIQVNVVEKDKYEVKQGFFGVEILSGEGADEKRESIPIVQSVDNWEYDFISAVYSVSREKKEMIGVLTGHEEKDLNLEELKKSYDVKNIKIETAQEKKGLYYEKEKTVKDDKGNDKVEIEKIFEDPITLLVVEPSSKLSDEEIAIVNDYVKNGGNLVVMAGSVNVSNSLEAQAVADTGLNNLLKKYGLAINQDLVYDASNSTITYQEGFFTVSAPYPFFVKAISANFANDPAFNDIQSVIFPWASSVSTSESDSYVVASVVSTTDKAGALTGSFDVNPKKRFSYAEGSKKNLVAISKPKDAGSKSGKVFAIGDSYFILLNFSKQVSDNETFFLNLIDSVSNTANLSSIRAKNIADRPIKELSESEKGYWKFVAILGGAFVLDAYGIYRIIRRKKKMSKVYSA